MTFFFSSKISAKHKMHEAHFFKKKNWQRHLHILIGVFLTDIFHFSRPFQFFTKPRQLLLNFIRKWTRKLIFQTWVGMTLAVIDWKPFHIRILFIFGIAQTKTISTFHTHSETPICKQHAKLFYSHDWLMNISYPSSSCNNS